MVDLLISFCYFGATVGKKLKTYPTGLGLLVPPVGAVSPITTTQDPYSYYGAPSAPSNNAPIPKDQAHKTKFNRSGRELLFEAGVKCPFRVGDWIVIQKSPKLENDLHCRITSTTYFPTVSVSEPITFAHPTDRETAVEKKLEEKLDQSKSKGKPQTPAVTPSFEPAEFYIYNCNFDEIGDQWKSQIILQLLCSLPSVQDMQEYINRTGKELSTWVDRVSPAAAAVLRWIIASSRACIFQVDDIDGNQKASTSESRVFGMTGWMQFRFAMGAPVSLLLISPYNLQLTHDRTRSVASSRKSTIKRTS